VATDTRFVWIDQTYTGRSGSNVTKADFRGIRARVVAVVIEVEFESRFVLTNRGCRASNASFVSGGVQAGKNNAGQQADDADHYQQFNEGKSISPTRKSAIGRTPLSDFSLIRCHVPHGSAEL